MVVVRQAEVAALIMGERVGRRKALRAVAGL